MADVVSPMERLVEAAGRGDVAAVTALLDAGVSAGAGWERHEREFSDYFEDYSEQWWWESALGRAVAGGYGALARLLVERGADQAARDDGLYEAVSRGDGEMAAYLLNHGASAGASRTVQEAYSDHEPIAYNMVVRRSVGETVSALSMACRLGYARVAFLLLGRGATPEDFDGTGALLATAEADRVEDAAALLDRGAGVDAARDGVTGLLMAARFGGMEVARLLVARGAVLDAMTSAGETPLTAATAAGDLAMVRFLLRAGARAGGARALVHIPSSRRGRRSVLMLEALLDTLGDDLSADDRGKALSESAAIGDLKLTRRLLDRGAPPDGAGLTSGPWPGLIVAGPVVPLMAAAMPSAGGGQRFGVAALLLDRGADVNASAEDGVTALMAAAASGDEKMVRFLLERGADARLKSRRGETAREIASRCQAASLVPMLEKAEQDGPVAAVKPTAKKALRPGGP